MKHLFYFLLGLSITFATLLPNTAIAAEKSEANPVILVRHGAVPNKNPRAPSAFSYLECIQYCQTMEITFPWEYVGCNITFYQNEDVVFSTYLKFGDVVENMPAMSGRVDVEVLFDNGFLYEGIMVF